MSKNGLFKEIPMPKTDLLKSLLRRPLKLSRTEKFLLEIKFFLALSHKLNKIFKTKYDAYQQLIKSNKENTMEEVKIIQEVIRDIILSEEYSLSGIARYAHVPEEIVYDLAIGLNTNPTFKVAKKLFELHVSVRRELYKEIIEKILIEDSSNDVEDKDQE